MYARVAEQISPGTIDTLFRDGSGALFPWTDDQASTVSASMSALSALLAGLAPEDTFPGLDNLRADRQSFWLASRGLGNSFEQDPAYLASLDGDPAGGRTGLSILREHPECRTDLETIKQCLDDALGTTLDDVGVSRSLWPQLTIRYRMIRYVPLRRPTAGIGLHPDGNLLSALVTNAPGLTLWHERGLSTEPPRDGTLVLPGSILYRWSAARYEPTFHRVEVSSAAEPKFSMVAFLNFPDATFVPGWDDSDEARTFFNDVRTFKEDDMDREGDLATLWSRLGTAAE